MPPERAIPPSLEDRILRFTNSLRKHFRHHQCRPNLLRHHESLLESLQESKEHIVLPSDKNLGPVIMECTTYIRRALDDHLLMATNYKQLWEDEATSAVSTTRGQLNWFFLQYNSLLTKQE